jgi:hypothetical protein
VAELRRRLVERLQTPFGVMELAGLFRPAGLVQNGDRLGAVDSMGEFLALDCPKGWASELPALLPGAGGYALFGLLDLDAQGLVLRCLSAVSPALRWARGPVYPDGAAL